MAEKKTLSQYLPQLIENTRSARIQSEKRLLEFDTLLKHATIYYACITTLLSIVPLFLSSSFGSWEDRITFLSIASAIIITICTIYASGQSYAVRAEQMRHAYLELQRLWLQIDTLKVDSEEYENALSEIAGRYVDIVASTENHTESDYLFGVGDKVTDADETIRRARYILLRFMVYIGLPILLVAISILVIG